MKPISLREHTNSPLSPPPPPPRAPVASSSYLNLSLALRLGRTPRPGPASKLVGAVMVELESPTSTLIDKDTTNQTRASARTSEWTDKINKL